MRRGSSIDNLSVHLKELVREKSFGDRSHVSGGLANEMFSELYDGDAGRDGSGDRQQQQQGEKKRRQSSGRTKSNNVGDRSLPKRNGSSQSLLQDFLDYVDMPPQEQQQQQYQQQRQQPHLPQSQPQPQSKMEGNVVISPDNSKISYASMNSSESGAGNQHESKQEQQQPQPQEQIKEVREVPSSSKKKEQEKDDHKKGSRRISKSKRHSNDDEDLESSLTNVGKKSSKNNTDKGKKELKNKRSKRRSADDDGGSNLTNDSRNSTERTGKTESQIKSKSHSHDEDLGSNVSHANPKSTESSRRNDQSPTKGSNQREARIGSKYESKEEETKKQNKALGKERLGPETEIDDNNQNERRKFAPPPPPPPKREGGSNSSRRMSKRASADDRLESRSDARKYYSKRHSAEELGRNKTGSDSGSGAVDQNFGLNNLSEHRLNSKRCSTQENKSPAESNTNFGMINPGADSVEWDDEEVESPRSPNLEKRHSFEKMEQGEEYATSPMAESKHGSISVSYECHPSQRIEKSALSSSRGNKPENIHPFSPAADATVLSVPTKRNKNPVNEHPYAAAAEATDTSASTKREKNLGNVHRYAAADSTVAYVPTKLSSDKSQPNKQGKRLSKRSSLESALRNSGNYGRRGSSLGDLSYYLNDLAKSKIPPNKAPIKDELDDDHIVWDSDDSEGLDEFMTTTIPTKSSKCQTSRKGSRRSIPRMHSESELSTGDISGVSSLGDMSAEMMDFDNDEPEFQHREAPVITTVKKKKKTVKRESKNQRSDDQDSGDDLSVVSDLTNWSELLDQVISKAEGKGKDKNQGSTGAFEGLDDDAKLWALFDDVVHGLKKNSKDTDAVNRRSSNKTVETRNEERKKERENEFNHLSCPASFHQTSPPRPIRNTPRNNDRPIVEDVSAQSTRENSRRHSNVPRRRSSFNDSITNSSPKMSIRDEVDDQFGFTTFVPTKGSDSGPTKGSGSGPTKREGANAGDPQLRRCRSSDGTDSIVDNSNHTDRLKSCSSSASKANNSKSRPSEREFTKPDEPYHRAHSTSILEEFKNVSGDDFSEESYTAKIKRLLETRAEETSRRRGSGKTPAETRPSSRDESKAEKRRSHSTGVLDDFSVLMGRNEPTFQTIRQRRVSRSNFAAGEATKTTGQTGQSNRDGGEAKMTRSRSTGILNDFKELFQNSTDGLASDAGLTERLKEYYNTKSPLQRKMPFQFDATVPTKTSESKSAKRRGSRGSVHSFHSLGHKERMCRGEAFVANTALVKPGPISPSQDRGRRRSSSRQSQQGSPMSQKVEFKCSPKKPKSILKPQSESRRAASVDAARMFACDSDDDGSDPFVDTLRALFQKQQKNERGGSGRRGSRKDSNAVNIFNELKDAKNGEAMSSPRRQSRNSRTDKNLDKRRSSSVDNVNALTVDDDELKHLLSKILSEKKSYSSTLSGEENEPTSNGSKSLGKLGVKHSRRMSSSSDSSDSLPSNDRHSMASAVTMTTLDDFRSLDGLAKFLLGAQRDKASIPSPVGNYNLPSPISGKRLHRRRSSSFDDADLYARDDSQNDKYGPLPPLSKPSNLKQSNLGRKRDEGTGVTAGRYLHRRNDLSEDANGLPQKVSTAEDVHHGKKTFLKEYEASLATFFGVEAQSKTPHRPSISSINSASRRNSDARGVSFNCNDSSESPNNGGNNTEQTDKTIKVIDLPWVDRRGMRGNYTGEVNNMIQPHGKGVLVYENGLVLDCMWCNGTSIKPASALSRNETLPSASENTAAPPSNIANSTETRRNSTNQGSKISRENSSKPEELKKRASTTRGGEIAHKSSSIQNDTSRSDYNLGDNALSDDHTIIEPSREEAMKHISSLKVFDFAFVRRTNGKWTYSIISDRSENMIRFVVDENGRTKQLERQYWVSNIRRARAEVKPENPPPRRRSSQARRRSSVDDSLVRYGLD